MTSSWKSFRICDSGRIVTGKTPKGGISDYEGAEVPFISPSDFIGQKWITKTVRRISEAGAQSVKGSLIPSHSVLVTCIGSDMGKAAITTTRCVTNQQINAVIVDETKFSPEFLYYNLSLRKEEIRGLAGGSAQPILNKSAFGMLNFEAPDLDAQKEISAILRPIDDQITLLREANTTLESISQAIFKSWFIDFDPVHAKSRGDSPMGMDEAVAAIFPAGFKDSELGSVPKSWRIGRLDDLMVLQRGFDLPAQDRVLGEFPIIAASGLSGSHHKYMVNGPGVITGRSGVLGRVFLELGDFWPLNTTLWVKEFKAVTPCYAYELLRLLDLKSFNAGSAVPSLNRNHIHGLPCLIPDSACVESFEEFALALQQRCRDNEMKAQTLISLRDTLLPRLISGQLQIPEAETLV